MKVWTGDDALQLRLTERPVLALGFFDGVHRGHQALVRRAVTDARRQGRQAGVLTFDPHPQAVLWPACRLEYLTTRAEKMELLSGLGLEVAVIYPFSPALAELSPEAFVRRILVGQLGVGEVVVGYNFTFGARGAGRYGLLRELGKGNGFTAVVIPPVTVGRRVVSSTAIRERLLEGRVEEAGRMLGYAYSLAGKVRSGSGRGRRLGFPTANLEVEPGKLIPADGVYLAGARLWGEETDRLAVVAVGKALTFGAEQDRVEVHLVDFAGDLYGSELRIRFHRRLRGMRRFPGAEELQAQMKEDLRRAKALGLPEGRGNAAQAPQAFLYTG
ncbi:MAG TPA: bifunctional riboflavin kinase/FAD synthetase [Firmicutes bacterium]|nr:bifunctional riboflavin kinase/FAD synthetase [Bacillota bacterium]